MLIECVNPSCHVEDGALFPYDPRRECPDLCDDCEQRAAEQAEANAIEAYYGGDGPLELAAGRREL